MTINDATRKGDTMETLNDHITHANVLADTDPRPMPDATPRPPEQTHRRMTRYEVAKWTPGPWAGEWQGAEYIVRAVEGRRDFPSDDLVARITCDAMSAETDGNMEVMRLAPEMAEALRKIEALELPRGGNYRTALLAWAAEVGDIARAILAKLEGADQ